MSELTHRPWNPTSDYPVFEQWWLERDGTAVPMPWLSSTGVVVENGCGPLAVSWLYLSNSKAAHVGWTTVKPGIPGKVAHKAVLLALRTIREIAVVSGVEYIQTLSNRSGLTKAMVRLGFERKGGYEFLACGGHQHGN